MNAMLQKIGVCVICVVTTIYAQLKGQNEQTQLQLAIPQLEEEIQKVEQKNTELLVAIETATHPEVLFTLKANSTYSHLQQPDEVIVINTPSMPQENLPITSLNPPLVVGAK